MPDHRRPAIPFSDAPQGSCRWCGEAILHAGGPRRGEVNRRRRWHPACVDHYNESDPREARRRLRKRDRGRCASCGLDTVKLRHSIRGPGSFKKTRELGFKPRRSFWELDHIVPLIDGGSHDFSNLQTLCTPCHQRKTTAEAEQRRLLRAEAAERSVLARADELLADSERLLRTIAGTSGLVK
jgi:5-methylcytosine-specific restriction endonuclease McrA